MNHKQVVISNQGLIQTQHMYNSWISSLQTLNITDFVKKRTSWIYNKNIKL